MENKEILNLKEACKLLGISRPTILKYLHNGKLPARRLGRKWLFSKRQLISWVEKGKGRRR